MKTQSREARQGGETPKLYTAVVGDILDTLGYSQQFLPPRIRPVSSDLRIVGRAMPVRVADVFGRQEKPFGLLTEALDQLQEGEIYVSSAVSQPVALWGEILSATAEQRGAVGAVIDGHYRDTRQIRERNFPVFGWSPYGTDSSIRSVVAEFRVPVSIGQVYIHPGELLVADVDGVVVIPSVVEDEVLALARDKMSTEGVVCSEIDKGMSATEAFKKYGVL